MDIKLDSLNSGVIDEIIINEKVVFDCEIYKSSEIKNLKNVSFDGKIFINESEELILEGLLKGTMTLEDSISLDEIDYNFSINIEEILENDKNNIDIIDILWQNIVLEVPSRYTEVTDYSKYSGDGWRLISEEDLNKENNPFNALKDREEE